MKTQHYLFLIALWFLASCGCGSSDCLTDQDIANYLAAYKSMREVAPELAEEQLSNKEADLSGKEGFEKMEEAIKKSGIKDYKTFVFINAKIGAIISVAQGENAVEQFEAMTSFGARQLDSAIRIYDSLIADPNVPEENKVEYRKAREQTVKARGELKSNWEYNKEWAQLVLDKAKYITDVAVAECDVEMVSKHMDEILEVYKGIPDLPPGTSADELE